jgi:Protein of unknown function with HXXEE motif
MRRAAPRYAFAVNRTMAMVINALMFVVLQAAPFAAHAAPLFALSAAGLGAVNSWSHVAGTVRGRRYVPGVVTGLFVYQPVAAFTYLQFATAGHLTGTVLAGSLLLGAAYHLVPLGLVRLSVPTPDPPSWSCTNCPASTPVSSSSQPTTGRKSPGEARTRCSDGPGSRPRSARPCGRGIDLDALEAVTEAAS